MKLEFKNLCRGDGKLFFHASVQNAQDDAPVFFRAFAKNGTEVPVIAAESAGRSDATPYERVFSIALPLLTRNVHFVCFAPDENGSIAVQATQIVNPFEAKWRGRTNTLVANDALGSLRDFDKRWMIDRVVFKFWDYLAPIGKDGLLRGTAFVPQALGSRPPELKCLAGDLGKSYDGFIVTAKREIPLSDEMSAPLWEVSFSLPVAHDEPSLTFFAVDGDGFALPGFETLDAPALQELAGRVAYQYDNAQWSPAYDAWFHMHRASEGHLELQRRSTAMNDGLKFSIVVPLFNTPPELFADMVRSVCGQTYENWELLLVNASPEDATLVDTCARAAAGDSRIQIIELEENLGIALNTNEGVKRATGDFVCFFDHDDVLEPDILYEYALALADDPEIDMLYCDEDKLLPDGTYAQPFFKPDFSIDLLRSNNYVCHMLTVRAKLLESLPTPTSEFDGAQDHNLTLMAAEKTQHIHHVPKVLYHWRVTELSVAGNEDSKAYANDAGIRAVQAHLERLGIPASVGRARLPFTYRVDYAVQGDPLVSVIIPNKDHAALLDTCLSSIFALTDYPRFEVVVVENNSEEEATFEYYGQAQRRWTNLRVVEWPHSGFNYSKIMNYGVSKAQGDYLLLLNNDIEVITPSWMRLMLGICQRGDVGAVGAQLYYPDDTIQHAGVGITGETAEHIGKFLNRGDQGYFGMMGLIRNMSCVTAACMMTPRAVFQAVGGFNTALAVAYNDVDYCLKVVDAGKLVVMNPYVELYHYESVSRGFDCEDPETEARAQRETALLHHTWVRYYRDGDPYLNPNIERRIPDARYYRLKY